MRPSGRSSSTRAPMYRLAARLVGDLAEAEDALQEAFVDAYRALREGATTGDRRWRPGCTAS